MKQENTKRDKIEYKAYTLPSGEGLYVIRARLNGDWVSGEELRQAAIARGATSTPSMVYRGKSALARCESDVPAVAAKLGIAPTEGQIIRAREARAVLDMEEQARKEELYLHEAAILLEPSTFDKVGATTAESAGRRAFLASARARLRAAKRYKGLAGGLAEAVAIYEEVKAAADKAKENAAGAARDMAAAANSDAARALRSELLKAYATKAAETAKAAAVKAKAAAEMAKVAEERAKVAEGKAR